MVQILLSKLDPERRAVVVQMLRYAIAGGLIIGLVESFAGFYLAEGFKDIAAYIVVLVVLMVKPSGLFGDKLRKKV